MKNKVEILDEIYANAMPQIKLYLESARKLIGDESRWLQGSGATDGYGKPCDPFSSTAACWCSIGALRAVMGRSFNTENGMDLFAAMVCFLNQNTPGKSILEYNDRTDVKHSNIMTVFDTTIENLKLNGETE